MQDNSDMTYYRSNLTPNLYNAVAYAVNTVVAPTDVNVQTEQSAPNGDTDVVYNEADYTGSWCGYTWHSVGSLVGYTYCASLSGSKCQRFDIYTDYSWEVTVTTTLRRRHACHEIGHSLGLDHPSAANGAPSTTCMAAGIYTTYDQTHEVVGHINPNY